MDENEFQNMLESGLGKWEYAGVRTYIRLSDGNTMFHHAVSVPHPKGPWDAIFCNSEALARFLVEKMNGRYGRRAPVQADREHKRQPGTISWREHEEVHGAYHAKWGGGQTAERLAERGGFGYGEIVDLLGHPPTTWEPR